MKIIDLIDKSKGRILNPTVEIKESFGHIKTDTRTLEIGDIFVALKGNLYDGHCYIKEAIEKGASAIFTEEDIDSKETPIIKVNNTYDCLFDFASLYLEEYPVFVVAVTGSVGKTTTKELIASMLSRKYQVLKSEGNKNNRIGIPETIFHLDSGIECLVVELGMNHFHEIEKLSNLVKPNIAVCTNIGSAHIGNLGSLKNILKAKMEIVSGMDGGILVLNGHDSMLNKIKSIQKGRIERVYKNQGMIQIELLEQSIFGSKLSISNGIEQKEVFFENPGEAVLEDIALALYVAQLLDISFQDMITSLEEYQPLKQRFLVEQLESGNILINDSYNSSYESLQMDLNILKKMKEHKILILGDILELGHNSKKIHKKIGKELNQISNVDIYLIGKEMKYTWKKCKKSHYYLTREDWILNYKPQTEHSIILLKGSRKMGLEELIPYIL